MSQHQIHEKCPKCGDWAKPKYLPLADLLQFKCTCGYVWNSKTLSQRTGKEVTKRENLKA